MKALTLRHPWAWAIVHCDKDVENRTWKPVGLEKGDFLALHGAVAPTAKLARTEAQSDLEWIIKNAHPSSGGTTLEQATLCGIVAVAQFAGVTANSASVWAAKGQFQWRLQNVVALTKPIECRGAQGLWNLPPDVLERVRVGYKSATGGSSTSAANPLPLERVATPKETPTLEVGDEVQLEQWYEQTPDGRGAVPVKPFYFTAQVLELHGSSFYARDGHGLLCWFGLERVVRVTYRVERESLPLVPSVEVVSNSSETISSEPLTVARDRVETGLETGLFGVNS